MARKSRKSFLSQEAPAASSMIRAAFYIRLSVEDTHTRTSSIETQQMIIQQYISRAPEISHCETYIDNGVSGTTFQRPAFQRMLADIEAGRINCVIVKDFSRLGRNAIDAGYYLEQFFPAHKVRFIAVTDNYDSADAKCRDMGIVVPLKNMVNEAYALDIGRKIRAQQRQAMKDGAYVGGRPPYGYLKAADNCHRLIPDPVAAPIVKQIFQWAEEGIGVNTIAKLLNEQGIQSVGHYKRDKGFLSTERIAGTGTWQSRTVAQILHRELYTGNMVQGHRKTIDHKQVIADPEDLIIVPNTHDAIVSQETFDRVQAILNNKSEQHKQKAIIPYTPNVLKGKIYCPYCGKNLNRQRSSRKTKPDYYTYYCPTNTRVAKGACPGVLIREDVLLPILSEILMKELDVCLDGDSPSVSCETRADKEYQKLCTEQKGIQNKLAQSQERIRGLYEHLVQGFLSREDYFDLKEQYEASAKQLAQSLEDHQKLISEVVKQQRKRQALKADRANLRVDPVLNAETIARLIERIEVTHEKEIRITFSFTKERGKEDLAP